MKKEQTIDKPDILHELTGLQTQIDIITAYGCKYYSGVVTIVGGAGDVTVNLPFDWTGGYINTYVSGATTKWVSDGVTFNQQSYNASYDSLTNAAYTSNRLQTHRLVNNWHDEYNPAVTNSPGMPKSATATSFTVDDSGTTQYVKYFIWA